MAKIALALMHIPLPTNVLTMRQTLIAKTTVCFQAYTSTNKHDFACLAGVFRNRENHQSKDIYHASPTAGTPLFPLPCSTIMSVIKYTKINNAVDDDEESLMDPNDYFIQRCQTLLNKANALHKLMDELGHTQYKANLSGAIQQVQYLVDSDYVAKNGVTMAEENLWLMHYCLRQDVLQQVKREMQEKRQVLDRLEAEVFIGEEKGDY